MGASSAAMAATSTFVIPCFIGLASWSSAPAWDSLEKQARQGSRL
jgi:hypothetical protein